jgi:WhiB family redox-sensing transcriptional regulator
MMIRSADGRQLDAEAVHWTDNAACRAPGTDPELFFPVSETGMAHRQVTQAKAVCGRCPVAEQCLEWAVRSGEPEGIWGGTTPQERRELRSELPRATRADSRRVA